MPSKFNVVKIEESEKQKPAKQESILSLTPCLFSGLVGTIWSGVSRTTNRKFGDIRKIFFDTASRFRARGPPDSHVKNKTRSTF